MAETVKEFFRGIPMFAGLTNEELDVLTQTASERMYQEGECIVQQGAAGDSLLLIRFGQVKIVLQRPSGEEILLSTFGPGDFFGEMSLFDKQPRSATAIALRPSQIVEISRQAFLSQIQESPDIALKILAEISHRIRETDTMVRAFADKVYTEAYGSLQEVLKERLATVEKLYESTDVRAARTLDRAEGTIGQIENLWKMFTRYGPALLFFVTSLIVGVTGFSVWNIVQINNKALEVNNKALEVNRWHNEVRTTLTDTRAVKQQLAVLRETMFTIRESRAAVFLDRKINELDADELRFAVLHYGEAKKTLQDYLKDHREYEPKVVLEAADTLWDLLSTGEKRDQLGMRAWEETWHDLREALTALVRQGQLDNNWRDSLRTRELLQQVAKDMEAHNKEQYALLVSELQNMVVDRDLPETPKIHAALLLADLHPSDTSLEEARALLSQTMKQGREARKNANAMRLIQIGGPEEREAWEYLAKQLRTNSLSVALLLGQLGTNRLEHLGIKKYVEGGVDRIVMLLKHGEKRNEYHKVYAERMAQCLESQKDKSSCP